MLDRILEIAEDFIAKIKPQPITVNVDGEEYAVKTGPHGLEVGPHIRTPGPIEKPTLVLQTLTGFKDAYIAALDNFNAEHVIVHVVDHLTVSLRALDADDFGRRHEFVRTVCGEKNPFQFNAYQVPEEFLIQLQSGFLPTENVVSLQKLASSLTNESSIGVQDDGISQVIKVKQGAIQRATVELPPRIKLHAYRTFREIDPVGSEFMVRMQGEPNKLPKIALLEVDAGKWKLGSIELIARWLKKELPDAIIVA